MIKSDLITALSFRFTQYPEKTVAQCANEMITMMGDALVEKNRIEIRGFGTFSLRYRPPRRARNPKTGETLQTKAKYTPHFKPGKELRAKVDETRKKQENE